jgi:hypothetical protein
MTTSYDGPLVARIVVDAPRPVCAIVTRDVDDPTDDPREARGHVVAYCQACGLARRVDYGGRRREAAPYRAGARRAAAWRLRAAGCKG